MDATQIVSWFRDLGLADRPTVGGKGASLGELQRAGIDVPPGFVVRTGAFEQFVQALEAAAPLRASVASLSGADLAATTALSRQLRALIEGAALPARVEDAIRGAHEELGAQGDALIVAVRSSATTEDSADASFAGLQDTYLWVKSADDVIRKVRSCWASLYSVESLSYRRQRALPESGVAMAVVVQRMVDARTAGVMFTRSPVTGDRSVIAIEGAWGLGSAVVSGEVTPDRWVVGKITGEITRRDLSDKAIRHAPLPGGGVETAAVADAERREPCLTDDELLSLRAIARRVEKHYGSPQDIEWAVERGTQRIYLLQSRPETVWANREAQAVAAQAESAHHHVMNIFGGQR